ncbi:13275_t:CDS:2 [Entrophospora sp. SA101]|nr:13275_t:CDS:2 [Entrophospora sp. SA101]
MTTDNGSNMVLASWLLNETFSKLLRLKCTDYKLQLTKSSTRFKQNNLYGKCE